MHRQIAGKLTGRVTKWLVLVVWIIIVGAAGSVASKLGDVQDNQASSWLPGSAESTKALEKLAPFQDQNDIPTVLAQYWGQLGLPFDPANSDHAETANAVTQITGGNLPPHRTPDDPDRPRHEHQPTGDHHPRRSPRRPADPRDRQSVSQIARPK